MDAWEMRFTVESTISTGIDTLRFHREAALMRMVPEVRAQVAWISAVVFVALTASGLTWIAAHSGIRPRKIEIINGTSMPNVFRVPPSKAHGCFKLENATAESRLTWSQEWNVSKLFLHENNEWISVKEKGVYLIYVQVMYELKNPNGNSDINLKFVVDFNYTEDTQEFLGAFETQKATQKEQDANLTALFLLHMAVGNRLSIRAYPKEHIKYDDRRPFSTFITIVKYADL